MGRPQYSEVLCFFLTPEMTSLSLEKKDIQGNFAVDVERT